MFSLLVHFVLPPIHICEHYGLRENYQLFHLIERMDPGVYRQRLQRGELPDILEIDARLTNKMEAIFKRLCPHPPQPYLERLNTELERLGGMLTAPDSIHDLTHVRPNFLVKYGINKNATEKIRREQIQKAYDGLEIRMARLTGEPLQKRNSIRISAPRDGEWDAERFINHLKFWKYEDKNFDGTMLSVHFFR